MISQVSGFKLLERNFKKTILLVPGWATDYRIFSILELDYNYLLPIEFSPSDFKDRLSELLNEKSLDKISVLGWSLGAFLAAEFAAQNPSRIDELILVSVRKNFEPKTLEEAKLRLKKNKRAYLYKFYLDCFSDSDREGLRWFRNNLLQDYISKMELDDLMQGLDYLSAARLDFKSLAPIKKIRVFQGLEDKIAPVREIEETKDHLPQAELVYMSGAGHIPFLSKIFRERFYNE
jgi:pimeloyl-[acyl-carrier protein] methyl ester esterase